jgi:hypothetical protein
LSLATSATFSQRRAAKVAAFLLGLRKHYLKPKPNPIVDPSIRR